MEVNPIPFILCVVFVSCVIWLYIGTRPHSNIYTFNQLVDKLDGTVKQGAGYYAKFSHIRESNGLLMYGLYKVEYISKDKFKLECIDLLTLDQCKEYANARTENNVIKL